MKHGLDHPGQAFVCHRDTTEHRRIGPKFEDHPTVGQPCPACTIPFLPGDYTALVAIGPGDDPESRDRARAGRSYTAVAVEVHWACRTGRD